MILVLFMYGKMQEFQLTEIILLIYILTTLGKYSVLFHSEPPQGQLQWLMFDLPNNILYLVKWQVTFFAHSF